ncbi:MAG: RNA polymerase factor sigma-54 [Sphaerochaeta sp.]
MNAGPGLTQTLRTEQTLSPQMLQSLALLPMSIQELKAHIQSEIESNPALEIPDSEYEIPVSEQSGGSSLDDRMDDADSSDYEDMSYSGEYSNSYEASFGDYDPQASDRKQQMLENISSGEESLQQHLLVQLGETPLTKESRKIGEMLISNLDRNGFFILPIENLFEKENFSRKSIEDTIAVVQSFEPSGICVPDFRASLILQAKMSGMANEDLKIFTELVNQDLEKLKAGKFKEIAASLRISEEDLQTFYSILKSFTPYPGQSYSRDVVAPVEPDFSIHNKNGTLVLELNRGNIPNLEIASDFEELAKNVAGSPEAKEAGAYIRDSVRQAKTLINQVNLRFRTLYKAAAAIMDYQKAFFFNGPRFLKTMTLKDISERIEVHETTMSRLAQSKWVETDWGLFQLKYFFSQGVTSTSDDKQSVSRNVVKDMIAEIISENGALSDRKISDLLLSRGIKCARRTVSKYRSELNIDSSYTR